MKKISQYLILLSIFLSIFTSQSFVNAQEKNANTQQNVHIDIKKDESSLEQKNINNHNFYFYNVKGEINPIEYPGKIIYLVLKKNDGPKKILMEYPEAIASNYEFPIYTERTDLFKGNPVLKQSDFLTEPGDYQYYFTLDSINGSAISRVIDLTTPIPSPSSETSTNTEQENTAQENTQTQQHETSTSSYNTHTDSNYGNLGGGGLVGTDCGYHLGPGKKGRICTFSDLMSLIARVIDYIFVLILPIAAIIFAYAGYLYITSGGNAEKRTAAKKAMTYLVVGVVVIMMAWLLVKTLLVSLGVSAGFTLFLDI